MNLTPLLGMKLISLGQKITFAFGEIIDNIANGLIKITGNVNVTGTLYYGTLDGEGNLNVNSSAFWDDLDSPSDITGSEYWYNQTYTGITGKWNVSGSNLFPYDLSKNVGIGTSSPSSLLHLKGTGPNMVMYDDANATTDGGGVRLIHQYVYTGTTGQTTGSSIKMARTSITEGNYGSYISFTTRDHGVAASEKVRIQDDGKVGIGATNPVATLQIGTHTGTIPANTGMWITGPKTLRFASIDDNAGYGAYIQPAFEGAGTERSTLKLGTRYGAVDKVIMTLKNSGKVGIGTESPSYPLEVNANVSGISIYAQANISATGFMTRTSVFDKSKGSALSFIQDSDYYKKEKTINHSKFYGYVGKFNITDYSRPVEEEYMEEECNETIIKNETIIECANITKIRIIYPYTKEEEAISINMEIDLLRQAIYELKQENQMLKLELCSRDNTYSWC
jgi:hypothetical protein